MSDTPKQIPADVPAVIVRNPKTCRHDGEYDARCVVDRATNGRTTSFSLSVRMQCKQCGGFFKFYPKTAAVDPRRTRLFVEMSPIGQELIPIEDDEETAPADIDDDPFAEKQPKKR